MLAIARLSLPLRVIAIVPLAENAVDGAAFKPGDILTAMDTTTVFIDNTDAEGRLVLADALCWADHYEPDAVIDLATLTRASASAMGDPYAALFTNSDQLREILVEAGRASDDLLWPMPIHEQHARELDHFKADIRNGGAGPGGASAAAAFLRYFVDFPWAHIDLAGKASWEFPRDYLGEGATGFGCRLLVEAAERMAATRLA
jgi:leucyl aminopeptidase